MSADENQAAADLAPRGWRNHVRSRRAREMRRVLAADDLSRENDPPMTEWWLEDQEPGE
ncbi:hypothetical protein ACWGJ9_07245 [Curtobacterium citreum]